MTSLLQSNISTISDHFEVMKFEYRDLLIPFPSADFLLDAGYSCISSDHLTLSSPGIFFVVMMSFFSRLFPFMVFGVSLCF